MKKIIFVLALSFFTVPCMANIKFDGKVVGDIIRKYVPTENVSAAIKKYNEIVNATNDGTGFPAQKLWNICDAAGWNVEEWDGKQKCEYFVQALLRASYSQYYDVCEKKGNSKGTERCIEAFEDIQVQLAQAENLAQEYAKVKYNDDIKCSSAIRISGNDDYIQCTSYDKKVFYEFRFDDARESNYLKNAFIRREFGKGLCIIYGGKLNSFGSESKLKLAQLDKVPGVDIKDLSSGCTIARCDTLGTKVKKWGYVTNKTNDTCVVSYKGVDDIPMHRNYVAKFDGKTFAVYYGTEKIKSWPAVSGRGKTSQDSRPTVCQTPKYQSCNHVGPTPAGTYYISQNEIEFADNIESGDFEHNSPKYSKKNARGNRGGWGDFRVLLVPDKSTNTYGRSGMYIHGGKWRGSAGCIDLTSNVNDFMNWFSQQTDFVKLKVIVDYGPVSGLCCTGKSCSSECTCPTEANVEQECKYL